jgi:hypothetical protein
LIKFLEHLQATHPLFNLQDEDVKATKPNAFPAEKTEDEGRQTKEPVNESGKDRGKNRAIGEFNFHGLWGYTTQSAEAKAQEKNEPCTAKCSPSENVPVNDNRCGADCTQVPVDPHLGTSEAEGACDAQDGNCVQQPVESPFDTRDASSSMDTSDTVDTNGNEAQMAIFYRGSGPHSHPIDFESGSE